MTQTVLLGVVCFCVPGMWNAMTSGALRDPEVQASATAALYACFTVVSFVAPIATNVAGPRLTLGVGSLGYIVYVLALVLYGAGEVGGGLVVAGGAVNGVGAGLFWTAQSQLILSYPSAESKGLVVGTFWVVFNLGGVVGGLLIMGANFEEGASGGTSTGTFAALGLVMALGCALTAALAPLRSVVRPDGSRVPPLPRTLVGAELLSMARLLRDWRVLLLLPLFVYTNFFYAVQFDFNARVFSARTQGLNTAAYWAAQMVRERHGGARAL